MQIVGLVKANKSITFLELIDFQMEIEDINNRELWL